jgi:hypothetical protein
MAARAGRADALELFGRRGFDTDRGAPVTPEARSLAERALTDVSAVDPNYQRKLPTHPARGPTQLTAHVRPHRV